MAPRRDISSSKDERAEMIEIARLHVEEGMTQEAIAEELNITQSTISRRLKRANSEHVIKTIITIPPIDQLYADLFAILSRRKKIREMKVLPRGVGKNRTKNVDNLGTAGAEFLKEIVVQHSGDHLQIAMSCGETLLMLLTRFVALLEQTPTVLKKLRKKAITLYPLNLYWGWTFDGNEAIYPTALVLATAVLLNKLGIKVCAYTPPPRMSFSREVKPNSDGEDHEGTELMPKYNDYIQAAEQADIFLLGIGTGNKEGSNYREVVKGLHLEDILKRDDIAGELNYQPYTIEGTFLSVEGFPGVQAKRLQKIAKTEKKVIAVAGGIGKADSVCSILKRNPPFNTLITDEDIAEKIMTISRWV